MKRVLAALSAMLMLSTCGLDVPAVAEAFLIGITPHDDFKTSGLVDVTVLPKDDKGQAIIKQGITVAFDITTPAGTTTTEQSKKVLQPDNSKSLATVLDLDSSGSMATTDPMQLRKEAAKQYVDQLGTSDMVAVYDFGAGSTTGLTASRLLSDFTSDKAAAKTAIDKITASGGTPLFASCVEVLSAFGQKYSAASGNRAMLLLSDGQPSGSGTLQACCDKAKETGIPVNTLGFGPAADSSPSAVPDAVATLRKIANCSGGAYTGVVEATGLSNTLRAQGQAAKLGSVQITVKFSPIPATGTKVSGTAKVGNGSQAKPVELSFTFVAP